MTNVSEPRTAERGYYSLCFVSKENDVYSQWLSSGFKHSETNRCQKHGKAVPMVKYLRYKLSALALCKNQPLLSQLQYIKPKF